MTAANVRGHRLSRRQFIERGVWVIGATFGALLGVPLVGFFASVLFKEAPLQWVPVATLAEVGFLEPRLFRVAFRRENAPEPYLDVRGVFVIRKGNDILAFTNVCTHMGCSVRWLDWRDQVLCPCHGGLFDRWGNLVGGPPPYSLPYYVSRIEGNVLYVANRLVKRSEAGHDVRAE